jgi:trehalose 6-phosphate phosphatase
MKDILSDESRASLDDVARERMLLAFDFDGTLAPIVEDRAAAQMRDSTRRLLRLASLFYPCAIISGRSRADLVPRLASIPLVAVVGNHGAEAGHGPVDRSVRSLVASWKASADAMLRGVDGIELEDKGLSLAIHYRRAARSALAERTAHDAARALEGARVFGGHSVVNVVPHGEHDKGEALSRVVARTGVRSALYVGDDTTDEDAFRSEAVRVSVRVGRADGSAASHFVASQAHVDEFLRALVRARGQLYDFRGDVDRLERIL